MGTPDFAVPFLARLLESGQEVVGVYTRKMARRERGQRLRNTPIYNLATSRGIPVFTPGTFRNGKNLETLRVLEPDLVVVVSYGLILPGELLAMAKRGCLNVHPSLLPRWRGCAPIERCLMSDDDETGVSIMKIDEGLDSGDVVASEKIPIAMDTDIASLRRKLADLGVRMLLETIGAVEKYGQVSATRQDPSQATFSERITSGDALVDWQRDSVKRIHRKIMALGDSVGVQLLHGGNRLKLIRSSYTPGPDQRGEIGTVIDKNFSIACRDGTLRIVELQREGKKPLALEDFINGYRFNIGDPVS
jgi:methionyl-tRNA formyltransferase